MSQPHDAALEAATIPRHDPGSPLDIAGPLPARPPFLALPTPLSSDECTALYFVAKAMGDDRADLSHTKTAVAEARAFLDIAVRRNGRNDYGATYEALVRATALLIRGLAALEARERADIESARLAHAGALERVAARGASMPPRWPR